MRRIPSFLLVLSLAFMAPLHAQAELRGELTVGEHKLTLNGAGARSKAFIQIYEMGLYLQQPSQDARAILDADELMAIRVHITSRFVSRSSLLASLKEGLVRSTGGKPEVIAKETELFVNTLKDEVNKNDVYDFVHLPNKGLVILKNGKVQGTVPGLAFKQALFGIWLSNQPVDQDLRQAMLSGKTTR